jgi:hypothetical protein
VNATLAPWLANASAIALPIPFEAPVTKAVFPSNNFMDLAILGNSATKIRKNISQNQWMPDNDFISEFWSN